MIWCGWSLLNSQGTQNYLHSGLFWETSAVAQYGPDRSTTVATYLVATQETERTLQLEEPSKVG